MSAEAKQGAYPLQEGEKATAVMVYTDTLLIWGQVITKLAIRVSTWLRTPAIPQFMCIFDAHIMRFGSGGISKPQNHQELYLPSSKIIAFHIKPPEHDPLDYDPNEPMRKMEPATALVGWFQFDGFLRMSTQTDIARFLDVTKEPFITMYDIEITQPSSSSEGVMRVPYALVRSENVIFSPRKN